MEKEALTNTIESDLAKRNRNWDKVDDFIQHKKHKGVLLGTTTNTTIPNNTFYFLPWDKVIYDTSGFYSGGQPTRITVPAGISKVKVSSNVCFNINTNGSRQAQIQKNNADAPGSGSSNIVVGGTAYYVLNMTSAVLSVVPGDYFEVRVQQSSGGPLETRNFVAAMWFSLEVVE